MKKRRTRTDNQILAALIAVLAVLFLLTLPSSKSLAPSGANISSQGEPQTAPPQTPQSVQAQAGNVTEINIFGYSSTQSWQGYFGNVTGTIQLADAQSHSMYNWTLASPQGEIYASTNGSGIIWGYIQCFNFTAAGNQTDDRAQAGNTSLYGTNLTQLETQYNISSADADGINETFTFLGAGTHDSFFTANQRFDNGECPSTRIFNNEGKGQIGQFEEVLLYEPVSTSVIYTALIEENLLGFDNRSHDFEMMVLENGHGTDVASTAYYFYVELE